MIGPWSLPHPDIDDTVLALAAFTTLSCYREHSFLCVLDFIFFKQLHTVENTAVVLLSDVHCGPHVISLPYFLCFLWWSAESNIGYYYSPLRWWRLSEAVCNAYKELSCEGYVPISLFRRMRQFEEAQLCMRHQAAVTQVCPIQEGHLSLGLKSLSKYNTPLSALFSTGMSSFSYWPTSKLERDFLQGNVVTGQGVVA